MGYLPDSVGFYPDLTGRENLCFTGSLNGLDRAACRRRADELLERVGMTYAADRKTGGYSRGMKQRLGIADLLMKDPKVIIMDEPTLGIDPEGMRELVAPLLVERDYTLLQLRQWGGGLDEIYRRYFEKAGDQHESSSGEQKSGWCPSVFRRRGAPEQRT